MPETQGIVVSVPGSGLEPRGRGRGEGFATGLPQVGAGSLSFCGFLYGLLSFCLSFRPSFLPSRL
jgi:hypothetical protein